MRMTELARSPLLAALLAAGKLVLPAKRERKAPRRRLPMAHGPGSINCKAEVFRLMRAGRIDAARDLAEQHRKQCGEILYARELRGGET